MRPNKVFLRPSGDGRPRLRVTVKDVSTKRTLFSCAPSDGLKGFGPGRPPRCLRDIPPKKLSLWAAFPFLNAEEMDAEEDAEEDAELETA